jgi:hypothetical protein
LLIASRAGKRLQGRSTFIDHWEVIRLLPDDFHWLLADATQRRDPNDRLLALRLAIESWHLAGRPFSLRWRLRATAVREPALRQAYLQSPETEILLPVKSLLVSENSLQIRSEMVVD